MRRVLTILLLALAAVPATASAATVEAADNGWRGNYGLDLVLRGGASSERLTVSSWNNGVEFEDLDEPLAISGTSASACALLDAHHVGCSAPLFLAIDGGAGDDTIASTGPSATLAGGDGNDTITGGSGGDVITGGAARATTCSTAGPATTRSTAGRAPTSSAAAPATTT
jgi:Ca2+-binding RTX toxin-like protein